MKLKHARNLAKDTMSSYLDDGWTFKFNNATRYFGLTKTSKKTIILSAPLTKLNHPKIVYNTILHEVAHAIVGTNQHHNDIWKNQALAIGCDGSIRFDTTRVKMLPKKWRVSCSNCGREYLSRRRMEGNACRSCCNLYNKGIYSERFTLKWEKA